MEYNGIVERNSGFVELGTEGGVTYFFNGTGFYESVDSKTLKFIPNNSLVPPKFLNKALLNTNSDMDYLLEDALTDPNCQTNEHGESDR